MIETTTVFLIFDAHTNEYLSVYNLLKVADCRWVCWRRFAYDRTLIEESAKFKTLQQASAAKSYIEQMFHMNDNRCDLHVREYQFTPKLTYDVKFVRKV